MNRWMSLAVAVAIALHPGGTLAKEAEKPRAFSLYSPSIKAGGIIPKRFTCDGRNVSPRLVWTKPPKGTKYYILLMEDPDAPGGTWVHWLIYDLPVRIRRLPEGMTKKESLPSGAKQGACWGNAAYEKVGYWGPCPPPGGAHNYVFTLYAMDAPTGLGPRATREKVVSTMRGHVIAKTELVALYGR